MFMPQGELALVGRAAVRASYEPDFNTLKLNARLAAHEIDEAGNWAWVRTSSAGRTRVLDAGSEGGEGNNELFVFRHEGDAWRIHRCLLTANRMRP